MTEIDVYSVKVNGVLVGYECQFHYNKAVVAEFQRIQKSERQYNGTGWFLKTSQDLFIARLESNYTVRRKLLEYTSPATFTVLYMGSAKERSWSGYAPFSYGLTSRPLVTQSIPKHTRWQLAVPGDAFDAWITQKRKAKGQSNKAGTYLDILDLPAGWKPGMMSPDGTDVLKSCYRKAAMRWHPDHNPSEEAEVASKTFMKIQEAFKALEDDKFAVKYMAALKMLSAQDDNKSRNDNNFASGQPPQRCGLVKVSFGICKPDPGKLLVQEILAWDDIEVSGKTLYASWNRGRQEIEHEWM